MGEVVYIKEGTLGTACGDIRVIQREDGMVEARAPLAILGNFNMRKEELERIDYNPFHPDYKDNYVMGVGKTDQEAMDALQEDRKDISKTLWL